VADRGRAPRLRRAARVGRAGRRARRTAGAARRRCSTSTAVASSSGASC
jgi:hypothetical protein